jgi:2-amino-4-hydroxy-6-hydroxymethyldihydropteridine diphosphokinase
MTTPPVDAVLALGSNLGDRLGNLRAAIALLGERGVTVARASSAWETAPVPADQPPFLNAVVAATTTLTPEALLAAAKDVERVLGRRKERHWGPRPIDADILFYGGAEVDLPDLVIPHPLIATRPFVLAPLGELISGPLPVLGESALSLLAAVDASGQRRLGKLLLPA